MKELFNKITRPCRKISDFLPLAAFITVLLTAVGQTLANEFASVTYDVIAEQICYVRQHIEHSQRQQRQGVDEAKRRVVAYPLPDVKLIVCLCQCGLCFYV